MPQFFKEDRRYPVDFHPPSRMKLDAQKEKRILVIFEMLLTEDNVKGAPRQIKNAFEQVSDPKKAMTDSKMRGLEFEHISIECYPLPDKPMAMEIKDATVKNVIVSRVVPKEGASKDVILQFKVDVSYRRALWEYVGEHAGKTIFVQFQQAQAVFQEADAPATTGEDAQASLPGTEPTAGDKKPRAKKATVN